MAITYTWSIDSMANYPSSEGQSNVVFQVNWKLTGTDGTYSASETGGLAVTYVAGEPYIPYAQLIEQQVIGWVTSSMNQSTLEMYQANIAASIAEQANPPFVISPLPWSN